VVEPPAPLPELVSELPEADELPILLPLVLALKAIPDRATNAAAVRTRRFTFFIVVPPLSGSFCAF
jgi:hypothetical protein